MSKVADLAITSIDTITAFDIISGAYLFTLDELQSASIAQGQEVSEITGKQGRKISQLKRNKTITVSGDNGLLSGGLLELQTGSEFEDKTTLVRWTDYVTVASNKATTTYTAVGTTGAEIDSVILKNADNTLGQTLIQDSTAASGKFAYTPGTKTLTFSGVPDGTEVMVVYDRKIQAFVHENASDAYSKKCALYIDAIAEDKCANVYRVQIFIPKADFNGEFSLEFGDNQSVHSFEAESLSGACGTHNAENLWTYTVFGANAADAT